MKKILFFFVTLVLSTTLFAQKIVTKNKGNQNVGVTKAKTWWEIMQDPNGNFYDAQKKFEKYLEQSGRDKDDDDEDEEEQELGGYEVFKRWESFVAPRVFPSGDLSLLSNKAQNYQDFLTNYNAQNQTGGGGKYGQIGGDNVIAAATWSAVGPMGPMAGTGNGQFLKSGRINGIVAHTTNTNIIYACGPAGGFWRSYNAGVNWVTTTDNMPNTGCSDAAIDPSNTNIIYLATGDGDAGDNPSIGVYKSFDAGVTFTPTGLTFTFSANQLLRRIICNPATPSVVIVASTGGIRRTTNGGTSWTTVNGTNSYDLEFQPGNPNIVYATGATAFLRSTDGGATWTNISSGIPTSACSRMAIAVTPNNPQCVYVLASRSSDNGAMGVYRSTDGGLNFTQMQGATTPNLLGWQSAGTDAGGQGWYDLCIAASPTNSNDIVTGGVNVWRSLSGGAAGTWTCYGHWTGSGAPFTHADQHDLEYDIAGNLYNSNDGTVYRRTGGTWTEVSGQMNLSQIYKVGTSAVTANFWITGHQDNGTSIWTGTTYSAQLGGDGMDCFIDRTTDANKFAEYYNGQFMKSIGGGAYTGCTTGMTGGAPWVTMWKQDPTSNTRLWAGRQEMFVSNNLATSWAQSGTMPVAGSVLEFAIAPSNNQIIYVLKNTAIIKSTDGGATWVNSTNGAPIGGASCANVIINPTNPNMVWVVLSGYSGANKVVKTINGGTSWTNVTTNLPNLPANCGVYQPGSNDRVYIGMDIGVYYIDNSSPNWVLYNYSLPNVPVSDLEISPADPTKLVASTYGRGTWKTDLIQANPPVSALSYTGSICTNQPKPFYDFSSNAPTAWSWSVVPGAGVVVSNSTVANPTITFANAGNYTVSLFTSNGYGPGTTASQVVSVTATPTITLVAPSQTICTGSSATLTANGAITYSWSNGINSPSIVVNPTVNTIYNVVGGAGGCTGSTNGTIVVGGSSLSISANSPSICVGGNAVLTASGATSYTWSNGALTASTGVNPIITTNYTVTGSNGSCNGTYVATVTVNSNPTVSVNNASICSGNNAVLTASGAATYSWSTGALTASVSVSPTIATVYTVTGTNGACSDVKTSTVSITPSPTVTANSASICSGQSAVLTASGATSYTWSTGALTASTSVNPISTTVYTVTGSTGACTAAITRTVTVTTSPTVSVNNASICAGQTAVVTASGATSYSWSTGALTASISVSPGITTIYTVTGTTGACTDVKTVTVSVGTAPTLSVNNANICSGNSAVLTASGATSYTWSTGALTASVSVSPISLTVYTVTGSSGGCASSITSTVSITPSPTVTANSASICSGQSAVLTASGATSYTWSTGALTASTGVNPIITTVYTVTGSNGTCASAITRTVTVTTTPTVSVNNASICAGQTAVVTASGATSYSWSTGALTASISVSPGITTVYTVTGTTGACTNVKTVTVSVGTAPTLSVNNASICNGNSAILTASGASSYTWSTGAFTASVSVSPISLTVYTVTGNSGGCNASITSTVTVNPNPTVTANSANICSGNSAVLTASGATSYTWSTGALTASTSVNPIITTVYTVTGSNGTCASAITRTVTVTTTPTVSVNNASICAGQTAVVTASGATSYSWSTGALTASISVSPGITTVYTVTGTTGACTNVKTVTVSVGTAPILSVNNATICPGNSAVLTASGATSYTWSTGALTASTSVSPLSLTVYTVTGNSGGCNASITSTVNVNASPTVVVPNGTICSGNSTVITASGAGSYTWSTGALTATENLSPVSTTIYTVTGSNGTCTDVKTMTVNVNATPTVVANNVAICGGGSTVVTASGATNYTWSTGAFTSSISVSPTITTVYTVTGNSGTSCNGITTVTVSVGTTPTVSISNNVQTICNGASANFTASGAGSYLWNTGANTSTVSVSPSVTTVYTVTGLSGGCSDVKTATVNVNALPSLTISASTSTICMGENVSFSVSGAGNYTWMPGGANGPSQTYSPSSTQIYTVNGSDANGCNNTQTVSIFVSPCTGILKGGSGIVYYSVFPNPSSDKITVTYPSLVDTELRMELIDATGRLIDKKTNTFNRNNANYNLSLAGITQGIYYLKLTVKGGESTTVKLIKE
jgi:hypothetical protein